MPQVGDIFSSGVDWVTATFKADDAGAAALLRRCQTHWAAIEQAGGKMEVLSPLQYHGVRGGSVFFGSRKDGHMFQATSAAANVWYSEVLKFGCVPNITRLDLQVTAYRAPGDFAFAPRYRKAVRHFEKRMGRARPAVLATVDKNLSGDSLRIGAPSSEFSMNIYDKSDESAGLVPPDLSRFESRNAEHLARRLWKELSEGANPQKLAHSHNLARLLKVGVRPEWADHAVPEYFTPDRPKQDDFSRLMWLSNDVSKTVAGLIERGYVHEVIAHLGLGEVVEQLARESIPGLKERLTRESWKAPPTPPRLETFLSPQGAREILKRQDREREKRTRKRLQGIAGSDPTDAKQED